LEAWLDRHMWAGSGTVDGDTAALHTTDHPRLTVVLPSQRASKKAQEETKSPGLERDWNAHAPFSPFFKPCMHIRLSELPPLLSKHLLQSVVHASPWVNLQFTSQLFP